MSTNPPTADLDAKIAAPSGAGEGKVPADAAAPWIDWGRVKPVEVAGLVAVSAGLLWAYWPNLVSLYRTWVREPDYSHGFLVLPIALVILWKLWPGQDGPRPTPWAPGWLLVLAALGARWHYHELGANWTETATLLPLVFGLGLARVGWRVFARIWPAFAFLVFLLPLPDSVNASVSQPLQGVATWCSTNLLKLSGLWVMSEGNVILVGNERLEVAAACNGLSMLMSLAATVAATVTLWPMSAIKRGILLGTIIPIALLCNVLRITVTAWCYYKFGAEVGSKYAHDIAGWAMMPLAMLMVWLEWAIMSWVVTESTVTNRPDDFMNFAGARS